MTIKKAKFEIEKIKDADLSIIQQLRGVGANKYVSKADVSQETKVLDTKPSAKSADLDVFLSMITKQPEENPIVVEEKEKYTENDMDSFLANFIKK